MIDLRKPTANKTATAQLLKYTIDDIDRIFGIGTGVKSWITENKYYFRRARAIYNKIDWYLRNFARCQKYGNSAFMVNSYNNTIDSLLKQFKEHHRRYNTPFIEFKIYDGKPSDTFGNTFFQIKTFEECLKYCSRKTAFKIQWHLDNGTLNYVCLINGKIRVKTIWN